MANPGPYPPMGHMQQMGGPQMPPMGMRPPMRQGTSHVVPVVVSAGLAVGVFCGLLFGLGTKHAAEPSRASNGAKQSEESQIQTAAVSTGTPKAPVTTPAAGSAAPTAGSTAPAAGSAAGATTAAAAPARPGKLTIEIKPDSAAASAKIFIDGRQLTTGTTADIAFDPGTRERTVKVVVQAAGYQEEQRDETVKSEEATSLSIPLKSMKPATGTAATGDDGKAGTGAAKSDTGGKSDGAKSTGKGTGKGSGSKSNTKGNGLIDI